MHYFSSINGRTTLMVEQALNTGELDEIYFSILLDLRNELLKIDKFVERVDFKLLVALAFVDKHDENKDKKYNIFNSQYSVEEYLSDAEKILTKRKDIQKLADKMNKKAKLFTTISHRHP